MLLPERQQHSGQFNVHQPRMLEWRGLSLLTTLLWLSLAAPALSCSGSRVDAADCNAGHSFAGGRSTHLPGSLLQRVPGRPMQKELADSEPQAVKIPRLQAEGSPLGTLCSSGRSDVEDVVKLQAVDVDPDGNHGGGEACTNQASYAEANSSVQTAPTLAKEGGELEPAGDEARSQAEMHHHAALAMSEPLGGSQELEASYPEANSSGQTAPTLAKEGGELEPAGDEARSRQELEATASGTCSRQDDTWMSTSTRHVALESWCLRAMCSDIWKDFVMAMMGAAAYAFCRISFRVRRAGIRDAPEVH